MGGWIGVSSIQNNKGLLTVDYIIIGKYQQKAAITPKKDKVIKYHQFNVKEVESSNLH